jgi:hypothetical protein
VVSARLPADADRAALAALALHVLTPCLPASLRPQFAAAMEALPAATVSIIHDLQARLADVADMAKLSCCA